jgi:predicted Rossmann fold flavoprotein
MSEVRDQSAAVSLDVLVVGAGAAGLATAIFTARSAPPLHVRCVDGAKRIGAKILVSGGARCNVTNREVTEKDFWGGSSRVVKHVLRAFSAPRAAAFFEEIGVALHEEEDGKLFPDTGRSRTVLDALLRETARLGVRIECERVRDIRVDGGRFVVDMNSGLRYLARRVVLATGGRSLPKTGSDGAGYELARRLGHGHVETTPALAPLVLDSGPHGALAGVSHHVALTLGPSPGRRLAAPKPRRGEGGTVLEGPMLWTHFGVSGPVALNISRHWHRAHVEGAPPTISLNVCPGETFPTLDSRLLEQQSRRPRARVATIVATLVPAAVAERWTADAGLGDITMAHLTREGRHRLVHALLATPLDVRDSRGYGYAEVTAGGVPLSEIDPSTMESTVCRGLHLTGEILDVDGRLGGFNFQWAWASGFVAGTALGRQEGQRSKGKGQKAGQRY